MNRQLISNLQQNTESLTSFFLFFFCNGKDSLTKLRRLQDFKNEIRP